MRFRFFCLLMTSLLALSACVVEPYGGREPYRGDHDDGRRVWHE